MKPIAETKSGSIFGEYDPAFEGVLSAFVDNFRTHNELGASVSVFVGGRPVVDLWGGRKADGSTWQGDTICMVWSCTKGVTAIAVHLAVERGLLDLDAPISKYWPEFARNGKQDATVRMALDHSIGVPALRAKVKDHGFCDHAYMAQLIADEQAFWKPGTRHGYHGMTFAWTIGELMRRATGRTIGQYVKSELADKLGADFWIGLPESEESRVSDMILPVDELFGGRSPANDALVDPSSIVSLMMTNDGGYNANLRAYRAAEVCSANGMSNGRGLARIYSAVANGDLLSPDTVSRMGRVSMASHEDASLLMPMRFSLGFMKPIDNQKNSRLLDASLILPENAFGHIGFGGSLGFADPAARVGFGCVMNRMGSGVMVNARGQALADAVYRSLGQ